MPILVVSSSSTYGERSRRGYRQAIVKELGPWMLGTTTGVPVGLEAERYLLASGLRSDMPGAAAQYDHLFCYILDGAQETAVRRVIPGAHDGPEGALRLDYPLTAALASGVGFELSVLPADPYQGLPGLNELIDEALSRLWIRDRLSITGNDTYAYSLSAYPWLTRPEQIVDLVDTIGSPTGWNPMRSATPSRLRLAGGVSYLETDRLYTSSETFYLDVYRPAHTWILTGGVWGEGDGLSADDDEANVPVNVVRATTLALAFRRLQTYVSYMPELARFETLVNRGVDRWTSIAAGLKLDELPRATSFEPNPEAGGFIDPTRGTSGAITDSYGNPVGSGSGGWP